MYLYLYLYLHADVSSLCRTETQFAEQLRASISNIEHGVAKD